MQCAIMRQGDKFRRPGETKEAEDRGQERRQHLSAGHYLSTSTLFTRAPLLLLQGLKCGGRTLTTEVIAFRVAVRLLHIKLKSDPIAQNSPALHGGVVKAQGDNVSKV